MSEPTYPISSVDNALRLLLLFRDRQVVRLTEASVALGVSNSTAHRLLAMAQLHGFVEQDADTRAYVAGPVLLDLGVAAAGPPGRLARARPFLEALAAEAGETAHLCVLQATNLVFVDTVEGTRAIRTGSRMGVALPAHCTSGGKAILAAMPLEAVAMLYSDARLTGLTGASITSFSELETELTRVRARGWATNIGESEAEVKAVGVAIPPPPVGPRMAFAVSAPRARLDDERIEQIAAIAARAASLAGGEGSPRG